MTLPAELSTQDETTTRISGIQLARSPTLAELITSHRDVLISRAHARVSSRTSRVTDGDGDRADGIPAFLDQLCDALRAAESSARVDHDRIRESAARHGHDLLHLGLTVAQVVQSYGDVSQVVTELAREQEVTVAPGEFQILNLCIDDAIANAVTEYSRGREGAITGQGTERLGVLAHELRNVLNTAFLSYEIIKSGKVTMSGSTGLVLGRSLIGLRELIDRSMADVRLDAGIERLERITVADFLGEVEIGASLQARARGVRLTVHAVDDSVAIEGDRQILAAALSNLLQNAFKFTANASCVSLTTHVTAERVRFAVEDECGGLPPGAAEDLFRPFEQRGADRSGIGLGLAICVKAAKANAGRLDVQDLPGKGCVFTLDLPRSK